MILSPANPPDRASYRNRGGIWQKLVSAHKGMRYLTACGKGVVIKRSAEFRLVKHAVLEVGDGVTIQDYAFC